MSLWRAEPVKSTGVIRPLRVAEINQSVCESVGGDGTPKWIGKIRAGFYNNNLSAGPNNVEPKLVGFHSEVVALGIPKCRRAPTKCRPPSPVVPAK